MLLGALAAVVVLLVLSIAWSVLRFHDYRLEAAGNGEDLYLSSGLLTRRSASVPRHRIQQLTIRQAPLHRWFGRVTIRIETAAGVGGGQQNEETGERLMTQRWFVPIVRDAEVADLLHRIEPRLDLGQVRWVSLPPRARRRMITRNCLRAAIVAALIGGFFWPWGLVATPVLLAWSVWHGHRHAAIMAWARTGFGMLFRSGVVGRSVSVTFFEKVQVLSVKQTPFDRRHRMARLRIDTAGAGPAGHLIHIPYLMADTAHRLARSLLRTTEGKGWSGGGEVLRNEGSGSRPRS